MGRASRDKGARGEREWRDVLTAAGYPAERGCQRKGGPDSPDVDCPSLSGLHFEVKRVEKLNIYTALGQAMCDAGDRVPIVAHRRNHSPWLVTLRAGDFFSLLNSFTTTNTPPEQP